MRVIGKTEESFVLRLLLAPPGLRLMQSGRCANQPTGAENGRQAKKTGVTCE